LIIELFAVLVGVALAAIFLGYYTRELSYAMIGLAFLFLIGILTLTTGVQFPVGQSVSASSDGTSATMTTTYDNLDSGTAHYFGYFLCIAGVAGVSLLFWNWKVASGAETDDFS
jgi:hypothetical protein